jgi:hypothetical protein
METAKLNTTKVMALVKANTKLLTIEVENPSALSLLKDFENNWLKSK